MSPRKPIDDDFYSDEESEFIEEYSEEDLEELYDLMQDFPEFDDYLEDLFSLDDEDFYEGGK